MEKNNQVLREAARQEPIQLVKGSYLQNCFQLLPRRLHFFGELLLPLHKLLRRHPLVLPLELLLCSAHCLVGTDLIFNQLHGGPKNVRTFPHGIVEVPSVGSTRNGVPDSGSKLLNALDHRSLRLHTIPTTVDDLLLRK